MTYEDLLLEKKDGIATITLNVPEKLNPITRKMGRSIPLAVDEIANEDEVRVVIVTAAGCGCCAGVDIVTVAEGTELAEDEPEWALRLQSVVPTDW